MVAAQPHSPYAGRASVEHQRKVSVTVDELVSQRPAVNSWSPEYLDSLYEAWKTDPRSVEPQWQHFFQGFELGLEGSPPEPPRAAAPAPVPAAGPVAETPPLDLEYIQKQIKVTSLVYHYRDIGHLVAKLDPLGRERLRPEMLRLESFDLTEEDLGREFVTTVPGLPRPVALQRVIEHLEGIYCGTLGAEYMHIQTTEERRWIQSRLEDETMRYTVEEDERREILRKLHEAEIFEHFLHTRYRGQKRFSLEGSETLIPMLWTTMEALTEHDVEYSVLGMAHRGRLNVLANIMQKAYDYIFAEFEDNYEDSSDGGGDVKYHKGYSSRVTLPNGRDLHVTLTANPSHLEAVGPVVQGRCRARQRIIADSGRNRSVPILLHGDAAFSGQGIVAETFQMVKLPGYSTGGTIHIVVNNQIGFTTDPKAARSSVYCTDVAKMVQAPIFHVNGDDPDSCARIMKLAVDYRQRFNKDVVIDLWCYRKHGHNEGDEPAFTQPKMYEVIRRMKSVCTLYADQLRKEAVVSSEAIREMQQEVESVLEKAQEHGRETPVRFNQEAFREVWGGFNRKYTFDPAETAFPAETLREIARNMARLPDDFEPHPKLKRLLKARRDSVLKDSGMDWGTAETLAYGSLLWEGTPVRLTGQDSRRGTFSHRHAALTDIRTENVHIPLNHLKEGQARFCIYDSPLSEVSVVGFEYGYSLGDPNMLIIWEAQFGDFANGAQVVIDQFISCAETKWDRSSGLVLLLPHGYEGQGPEHSSARLERFLQLCAQDNMQVANPTTPAQFFHIMRRQMKRNFRKPLVIMSPKSLLRHPKVVSSLADLSEGGFQDVLDDPKIEDPSAVRRIILCSGKVYYDLDARREKLGNFGDTAILRLEELYPLYTEYIESVLSRYPDDCEMIWCQEEPKNMGAWTYISDALEEKMNIRLRYVGRAPSAAPAVGSTRLHERELRDMLEKALPAPVEAGAMATG